ncbi:hypothetical protein HCB29_04875 [Listeria booriae]|nr:hypothetical protein [Listeria booriae]
MSIGTELLTTEMGVCRRAERLKKPTRWWRWFFCFHHEEVMEIDLLLWSYKYYNNRYPRNSAVARVKNS